MKQNISFFFCELLILRYANAKYLNDNFQYRPRAALVKFDLASTEK